MILKARDVLRRQLMKLLDVPSIEEFDEKDQKLINEWLIMSIKHKGFHKYTRSRDRAFVQAMISMPIETEAERRKYYEYAGARQENARIFQRAQSLNERLSERGKVSSPDS